MRGSVVLGIMACITGLFTAVSTLFLGGGFINPITGGLGNVYGPSTSFVVATVSVIACVIGLVGGLLGMREGGALMIAGGVVALASTSLMGTSMSMYLLFGALLAIRVESPTPTQHKEIEPLSRSLLQKLSFSSLILRFSPFTALLPRRAGNKRENEQGTD